MLIYLKIGAANAVTSYTARNRRNNLFKSKETTNQIPRNSKSFISADL